MFDATNTPTDPPTFTDEPDVLDQARQDWCADYCTTP